MSISALGSASTAPVRPAPQSAERMEGSGPDRDGDSDDTGAKAATRAALPKGVGQVVDMMA